MTYHHSLPVILVSAVDEASAVTIISEIIDNEPPETNTMGRCRVWRLSNKYYTADVLLRPVGDDAPAPGAGGGAPAQGHLIYLTEQECREAAAETAERRAARGGVCGEEGVLLALCGAAPGQLPAALRAWARRRTAELVPLRAAPGDDDDDEPSGMERARAALHAHRWLAAAAAGEPHSSGSESEPEWAEPADGSEVDVERFAAALRLAAAARGELRALPRRERLDRAERLLAALCGAMQPASTPAPPPADAAVDDAHL